MTSAEQKIVHYFSAKVPPIFRTSIVRSLDKFDEITCAISVKLLLKYRIEPSTDETWRYCPKQYIACFVKEHRAIRYVLKIFEIGKTDLIRTLSLKIYPSSEYELKYYNAETMICFSGAKYMIGILPNDSEGQNHKFVHEVKEAIGVWYYKKREIDEKEVDETVRKLKTRKGLFHKRVLSSIHEAGVRKLVPGHSVISGEKLHETSEHKPVHSRHHHHHEKTEKHERSWFKFKPRSISHVSSAVEVIGSEVKFITAPNLDLSHLNYHNASGEEMSMTSETSPRIYVRSRKLNESGVSIPELRVTTGSPKKVSQTPPAERSLHLLSPRTIAPRRRRRTASEPSSSILVSKQIKPVRISFHEHHEGKSGEAHHHHHEGKGAESHHHTQHEGHHQRHHGSQRGEAHHQPHHEDKSAEAHHHSHHEEGHHQRHQHHRRQSHLDTPKISKGLEVIRLEHLEPGTILKRV